MVRCMSMSNAESAFSPEPDISPERISEIARGFQDARILLTAYELGVFAAIDVLPKTSAEVAEHCGTETRATDRLLNALCVLRLIVKEGGRFSNTPGASRWLVPGKPGYMAGLMHVVNLWRTWGTLTEAVRAGHAADLAAINDRGDEWLSAFIGAMHANAAGRAPQIVAMLDLAGVRRVLDVGGGSGAYAMAFAQASPEITAAVFDLPNVVPIARGYIAKEGLSARVETVAGDYSADELGRGYDLVFMSAIIHINSPDENRELFRKAARALAPGGRLVIQDFIVDENRTSPPGAVLFALNMLVGTRSGDTYTESEVRSWMEEAGFSQATRMDTAAGSALICGRCSG